MKSFNLTTIQTIRFILKDYLIKPGAVTTGEAIKIIEKNSMLGISRCTLRNVFAMIMADMVKSKRATKEHRGCWIILEAHDLSSVQIGCGGDGPRSIVEEAQPVTFNPMLTTFLDPPKCTKHVDVYNELKKLKDKSRFTETAIRLCEQAGISLTRLINYINEQSEVRHI